MRGIDPRHWTGYHLGYGAGYQAGVAAACKVLALDSAHVPTLAALVGACTGPEDNAPTLGESP
jgi:hypothetical protein